MIYTLVIQCVIQCVKTNTKKSCNPKTYKPYCLHVWQSVTKRRHYRLHPNVLKKHHCTENITKATIAHISYHRNNNVLILTCNVH